jgi:hypothetical protein
MGGVVVKELEVAIEEKLMLESKSLPIKYLDTLENDLVSKQEELLEEISQLEEESRESSKQAIVRGNQIMFLKGQHTYLGKMITSVQHGLKVK